MHKLIAALPRQAREAWAAGQAWELPAGFRNPRRVVVVGVGGSAIGADVVASLAASVSNVPVRVQRAYAAPVTDDETLVVACSFSGETEETLAALTSARDGPGMRLAITTVGGWRRWRTTSGTLNSTTAGTDRPAPPSPTALPATGDPEATRRYADRGQ